MSNEKNKIKFFIQNLTVGADCEFYEPNQNLSAEIKEKILNLERNIPVEYVTINNKRMEVLNHILPYSCSNILYFCNRCLFQFSTKIARSRHRKDCKAKIPGLKSYSEDDFSIYEVDGEKNKDYCKTLCSLGRCFLDSKTVDDYVSPFFFYIICKKNDIAGFYSREKEIVNCNLLSIVIFPDYQKQGLGILLVDYSYNLAVLEDKVGSPERPLSEAGERLFDLYWKTVIQREFLRNEKTTISNLSKKTGITIDDIRNILEKYNMVEKADGKIRFNKIKEMKKVRLLKGGTICCTNLY